MKFAWRRPDYLKPETLLVLLAVSSGSGAAVLAGKYVAARASATEARLQARYAPREVVVAAADVAAGDVLVAGRLAARSMPQAFLPQDSIPADQAGLVVGNLATIDIKRGTPISHAAIRSGRAANRLSQLVENGRRAFTIAVDQLNSLGGQVVGGDYIDLYYSRTQGAGTELMPLLQRVQVLATGESLGAQLESQMPADSKDFNTITLSITPDEAARIVLAQHSGSLAVVLRTPGDDAPVIIHVRRSQDLREWPAPVSRRHVLPGERVELLIGGGGGLAPQRAWLFVGPPAPMASEEPT